MFRRAFCALLFGVAFASVARAHSWYETECCGGGPMGDCAPIPDHAVRPVKGGYAVTIQPGEHPLVKDAAVSGFVAYADARQSQDGQAHACIVAGKIKCLYERQGGV